MEELTNLSDLTAADSCVWWAMPAFALCVRENEDALEPLIAMCERLNEGTFGMTDVDAICAFFYAALFERGTSGCQIAHAGFAQRIAEAFKETDGPTDSDFLAPSFVLLTWAHPDLFLELWMDRVIPYLHHREPFRFEAIEVFGRMILDFDAHQPEYAIHPDVRLTILRKFVESAFPDFIELPRKGEIFVDALLSFQVPADELVNMICGSIKGYRAGGRRLEYSRFVMMTLRLQDHVLTRTLVERTDLDFFNFGEIIDEVDPYPYVLEVLNAGFGALLDLFEMGDFLDFALVISQGELGRAIATLPGPDLRTRYLISRIVLIEIGLTGLFQCGVDDNNRPAVSELLLLCYETAMCSEDPELREQLLVLIRFAASPPGELVLEGEFIREVFTSIAQADVKTISEFCVRLLTEDVSSLALIFIRQILPQIVLLAYPSASIMSEGMRTMIEFSIEYGVKTGNHEVCVLLAQCFERINGKDSELCVGQAADFCRDSLIKVIRASSNNMAPIECDLLVRLLQAAMFDPRSAERIDVAELVPIWLGRRQANLATLELQSQIHDLCERAISICWTDNQNRGLMPVLNMLRGWVEVESWRDVCVSLIGPAIRRAIDQPPEGAQFGDLLGLMVVMLESQFVDMKLFIAERFVSTMFDLIIERSDYRVIDLARMLVGIRDVVADLRDAGAMREFRCFRMALCEKYDWRLRELEGLLGRDWSGSPSPSDC
jgi:hypothetical protein